MDAIPTSLLTNVGGAGAVVALLGWLYFALATGRVVTRREHENRIADKDKVIADRDAEHEKRIADKDAQITMWRAASDTKDAQVQEMFEHSRLAVQLMESLEAEARARRGDPS